MLSAHLLHLLLYLLLFSLRQSVSKLLLIVDPTLCSLKQEKHIDLSKSLAG